LELSRETEGEDLQDRDGPRSPCIGSIVLLISVVPTPIPAVTVAPIPAVAVAVAVAVCLILVLLAAEGMESLRAEVGFALPISARESFVIAAAVPG
jgi:hypothetical protein